MNEPQVSVQLENRRQCFQPGEVLRGEFHIQTLQPDQIKAIELSVIWLTEGKGDEDVGLHYFKRYSPDEQRLDTRSCVAFESAEPLPPSPLSYDGRIVKIRWCVRVRLFLPRGETIVYDEPFQLGAVPRPRLPEESDVLSS